MKHWAQGTPGAPNDTGREVTARWGIRVADQAGLAADNPTVSNRKMTDTCAMGTRLRIKKENPQTAMNVSQTFPAQQQHKEAASRLPGSGAQWEAEIGHSLPSLVSVLFKDGSLVQGSAFFLLPCRPTSELPQTGLQKWPESTLGQACFPIPLNVFDSKGSENPSDVLIRGRTVDLSHSSLLPEGCCPDSLAPQATFPALLPSPIICSKLGHETVPFTLQHDCLSIRLRAP